jgi:methylated-DNA-protein-cysteine methyltransferase-like protein
MGERSGVSARPTGTLFERVYAVARLIPKGRIATYGQIAAIVGRCTPRQVGYAMAAVPHGSDIPWQRVINARGEISERSAGDGRDVQRALLEAEGVRFDERGRVDLSIFGWTGPGLGDRGRSAAGSS